MSHQKYTAGALSKHGGLLITLGLVLVWLVPATFAQTGSPQADWSKVIAISTGRLIRVDTSNEARPLAGTLIAADENGLTLVTKEGRQRVERVSVRRVQVERSVSRALPWLAMGAGAATIGIAAAGQEDLTGGGKALWVGVGAGVGLLVGTLAKHAVAFETVYVAVP